MKLELFTLVLDGMPFLPMQLATFQRLTVPWHWTVAHGVARNVGSTSWCQTIYPRLSCDGSTEFLASLKRHPCVTVLERELWEGKDQMANACLEHITKTSMLMQVDVDELWLPAQLDAICRSNFTGFMKFRCRYFIGQNIVTVGDNCYGNNPGEWVRCWYFNPGTRFISHEPPILSSYLGANPRDGMLVFDHWAYMFPEQVKFKEKYYGYRDAFAHWQRLQENTEWPVRRLRSFLPWVDERAGADLLIKV